MKVREMFVSSQANLSGLAELEGKRTARSGEQTFNESLNKAERQNSQQKLRELADRIIEQGKLLGEKVDIKELRTYKKLVSDFLKEAVGSFSRFCKENYLDRRGRYRVYSIVKKINAELEELTQEVLKAEKNNIAVLKKLDDIRGLILDLLL